MEKILKLSYVGFRIFSILICLHNKYYMPTFNVHDALKRYVRTIEKEDYEEFSFIRILSDSVDKSYEEFLEVIDVAIQDLVTSIKLGEL